MRTPRWYLILRVEDDLVEPWAGLGEPVKIKLTDASASIDEDMLRDPPPELFDNVVRRLLWRLDDARKKGVTE